ncbi:hypothetical protein V498_05693 [Pseudogymnoascus sp. VKM F-4517 (FW-2822)]|nr:hypothetical protein V498_05693 [Pseudogymnoascus sp. VKM F-4517 (FW-2822)]
MRLVCWQHSIYSIPVVACSRLRSSLQYRSWKDPPQLCHSPHSFSCTTPSQKRFPHRHSYSISSNASPLYEDVYIPEVDLEDFEDYTLGGYHPTVIGDQFHNGRYEVVHKLGFGGYSTIWLAQDKHLQRYVSLEILVATESSKSTEGRVLRMLCSGNSSHPGQWLMPHLLDEFLFDGPNGRHVCLVQEPAGSSVAISKEDSVNFMFPIETARSIVAQLIMGVSYLHSRGVVMAVHLHTRNFLLCGPNLDRRSPDKLYNRYRLDKIPVTRFDGAAVEPRAPPYAVYPMRIKMPADMLVEPIVNISDYGTSFMVATEPSPELHTPALYLPPEDFFNEPITQAADIWTLAVNLYDVLGERALFETFGWDRDDIMAEMVSTLGPPPTRWWDAWGNRKEFFEPDGSWVRDMKRIYTPVFRPLHQRMWDMGRGETPESCQWDVKGGEMQALEELLRGMMAFELAERLTAEQLMTSEYMVKWAMPAWERQLERRREGGLE